MNIETEVGRKQLSQQLKADIDNWCIYHFDDGPRSHLGASEIGHNCSRYLFFKFRWMFYKKFDGRMQRLLNRGHYEEPRFVQYLEGINCEVKQFAKILLYHPESDCYFYGDIEKDNTDGHVVEVEGIPYHEEKAKEKGIYLDKGKRQIRISSCKGHFGGSIDAMCKLPTRYGISENIIFLDEFKTQGLGKQGNKISNFEKLVKAGVKSYKPVHWAQQCIYGFKLDLNYSIYLSVNKNDDDLHIEVIKLDHSFGRDLERKAEMIIFSETPPSRIAESPAFFECSYCDAVDICHHGKKPLVNCRSCKNACPVDEAYWWCCAHKAIIPKEDIGKQYECWESLL